MENNTHISTNNRKMLKKVIFELFPKIRKIKFKNEIMILKKKGLFTKKQTINVAEFIFEHLIVKFNNWSEALDLNIFFPFFETKAEGLDYFTSVNNAIDQIFNTYSDIKLSVALNNNFSEELHNVPKIQFVENSKMKKKFKKVISNYKRTIDEIINNMEIPTKVIYVSKSSAGRSPPNIKTIHLTQYKKVA